MSVITAALFSAALAKLVGCVLMVVGLMTSEWVKSTKGKTDVNFGIFEFCTDGDCKDKDWSLPESGSGPLDTVRFLSVFGASTGCMAFVLSIIFASNVYTRQIDEKKDISKAAFGLAVALCGITAILVCASCGLFKEKVFDKEVDGFMGELLDLTLGFSFVLTLIGGITVAVAGLITLVCGLGRVRAS